MITAIYLKTDHTRPNNRGAITRAFVSDDGYVMNREGEWFCIRHPKGAYVLRVGGSEIHEVREVDGPEPAKTKPKEAAA